MNNRIEELAQCNERILNFFQTGPVQRAAIEQFAELIVRECADIANINQFQWNSVGYFVLKHFEIE
jgi:hypothetical protein